MKRTIEGHGLNLDTVDHILAVYQMTYASRVGRVDELADLGGPSEGRGEGRIRLDAFFSSLAAAYSASSLSEAIDVSLGWTGTLKGLNGFQFEIKATEDYNPDPREADSYGTYLSLTLNGLGAFQHLRIQSKNEHALFLRHVQRLRRHSSNGPDMTEKLMIARRRGIHALSPENAEREAAFIERFLASQSL